MVMSGGIFINGETDIEIAGKSFANALVEVIRTAAGLEAYECQCNMGGNKKPAGYISGMMLLCGEKNAVLSITMAYGAAYNLVSYMTGTLPEEIEKEELWDGIAELTNMIAGRAKADLTGTDYHFRITPPFSIQGQDYTIVYKNRIPRICKKFAAEDIEMFLEIVYI